MMYIAVVLFHTYGVNDRGSLFDWSPGDSSGKE